MTKNDEQRPIFAYGVNMIGCEINNPVIVTNLNDKAQAEAQASNSDDKPKAEPADEQSEPEEQEDLEKEYIDYELIENGTQNLSTLLHEVDLLIMAFSAEDRITAIAYALKSTFELKYIKQAQDFGALKHLIGEERKWIPKISSKKFAQILEKQCGFSVDDLPSESTLRVLSFGHTVFPFWNVTGYNSTKIQLLNDMVEHFLRELRSCLLNMPEPNIRR